jgi:hypothetical protein
MSVTSLLKHSCSTARNVAVGTNGRKQYQALLANVRCMFTPMSAQASVQNQFDVGFGWDVFFPDGTDVQIGDKLTWNGRTYLVRGRQPFTGYGRVSYLEVSAETEQANGQ